MRLPELNPSLAVHRRLFLLLLSVLPSVLAQSTSSYLLQDSYAGATFFDDFTFFTDADPTHGFVSYVSQPTAQQLGLISLNSAGAVYMGVDATSVLAASSTTGRQSVRIASTHTYDGGLIILDVAHMPGGVCGAWPAFWTVGPDWPNDGEIDIVEGVNAATRNLMSLHTGANCSVPTAGITQSGTGLTTDCYQYDPAQSNSGCGVQSTSPLSFGSAFNAAGGGVFATEWSASGIRIWFFPRGAIPADITSGAPTPNGWGVPAADFPGGASCDIGAHFREHRIVFDTTFCGDWAGAVFNNDPICAAKAPSCQAFVAENPTAFEDAYWLINSLLVYQTGGAAATTASAGHTSNASVVVVTAIATQTQTSTVAALDAAPSTSGGVDPVAASSVSTCPLFSPSPATPVAAGCATLFTVRPLGAAAGQAVLS